MRASTLRPTAALPTARRARRRAAAPRAPRAESNFDEPSGPQPAAVILGVGIGMMVNASSFLCAYRVMPEMRLLAGILEEVQAPELHAFMGKIGVILASPADIFLLTVCLLLIELRRLLDE